MSDLRNARIVVTIPPKGWFGGFDRLSTFPQIEQIEKRFNIEVYQLDTTPWALGSEYLQKRSIEHLRSYGPQLAISLNNAGYAFLCTVPSDDGVANLFTDVLGIPLVLPWDHGLFQFPSLIPRHFPDASEPASNVVARVRRVLDNPLIHHLPIDAGQVDEMRRLGLMTGSNYSLAPAAAYSPYLDFGLKHPARSQPRDRLSFIGNLYAGRLTTDSAASSLASACHRAVTEAKAVHPLTNAWGELMTALGNATTESRKEAGLSFDDLNFWRFADDLIRQECNMIARTQIIETLAHRVGLYGEFAPGASVEGLSRFRNVDYKGFVDFGKDLPRVYADAEITLDVTNAAFISNCSSKPICCLASGGFPIFDFKPQAAELLGPDAASIMYNNDMEMNEKIEYYLSRPKERNSLARHLQQIVRKKCDFANILFDAAAFKLGRDRKDTLLSGIRRLFSRVGRTDETNSGKALKVVDIPAEPVFDTEIVKAFDLARDIRVQDDWAGARIVQHSPLLLQTADQAWSYSASLDLSSDIGLLDRPGRYWLEIEGNCISGDCGVGLLYGASYVGEFLFAETKQGTRQYLHIPYVDELQAMLIRCQTVHSSVVRIDSIRLLRERVSDHSLIA